MILQLASLQDVDCSDIVTLQSLIRRFNTSVVEQHCLNSNPNYGSLYI